MIKLIESIGFFLFGALWLWFSLHSDLSLWFILLGCLSTILGIIMIVIAVLMMNGKKWYDD